MTARAFVDTNVWVYAVDGADPAKQGRAREVLAPSATELVTSAQVLGEFYVTVTRKLPRPVAEGDARRLLERLRQLPVVAIDADRVAEAVDASQAWGISYWDALIVVAARSAGCSVILTEDLSDGAAYDSVRVENPFGSDRRVSEAKEMYEATDRSSAEAWSDGQLSDALTAYERACIDAGMRRNAVHAYWDYARRFLAWRTGDYRPRGVASGGRPVPSRPVRAEELAEQAGTYARAIEEAGREQQTVDTYHRHAMFFIRWLRGDFTPGSRLR